MGRIGVNSTVKASSGSAGVFAHLLNRSKLVNRKKVAVSASSRGGVDKCRMDQNKAELMANILSQRKNGKILMDREIINILFKWCWSDTKFGSIGV